MPQGHARIDEQLFGTIGHIGRSCGTLCLHLSGCGMAGERAEGHACVELLKLSLSTATRVVVVAQWHKPVYMHACCISVVREWKGSSLQPWLRAEGPSGLLSTSPPNHGQSETLLSQTMCHRCLRTWGRHKVIAKQETDLVATCAVKR